MKIAAGILLYRFSERSLQVLLVHPGGPFFAKKNEGWWTIPKGEPNEGEELLAVARREFEEETGYKVIGKFTELQPVLQKGGKKVYCWAAEGDIDAAAIKSNTFEMEWPPKSGLKLSYPEVDRAGWFNTDEAKLLINERQADFITQLQQLLTAASS